MNAEVICTSLDLCNNLDPLQRTEKDLPFEIYQAFSPDSILRIGDIESFKKDLSKLEALTNIKICTLDNLIEALKTRHDFFDSKGCRLSHHSISYFPFSPSPASEVSIIVKQVIDHNFVGLTDVEKYQTYILTQIAKWNYEKKWIQLFH
ncbi:MAG: glucuronate isomerase, partial [Bacteroidota bacterium]